MDQQQHPGYHRSGLSGRCNDPHRGYRVDGTGECGREPPGGTGASAQHAGGDLLDPKKRDFTGKNGRFLGDFMVISGWLLLFMAYKYISLWDNQYY